MCRLILAPFPTISRSSSVLEAEWIITSCLLHVLNVTSHSHPFSSCFFMLFHVFHSVWAATLSVWAAAVAASAAANFSALLRQLAASPREYSQQTVNGSNLINLSYSLYKHGSVTLALPSSSALPEVENVGIGGFGGMEFWWFLASRSSRSKWFSGEHLWPSAIASNCSFSALRLAASAKRMSRATDVSMEPSPGPLFGPWWARYTNAPASENHDSLDSLMNPLMKNLLTSWECTLIIYTTIL